MAVWIVALMGLALYLGHPLVPVVLAASFVMIGISYAVSKGAARQKILNFGLGLAIIAGAHFIVPALAAGMPHQAGGSAPPELLVSIAAVGASDGLLLAVAALSAFGSVLIGMFSEA